MSAVGREIERKYVVGTPGANTLTDVERYLDHKFSSAEKVPLQVSRDVFWTFPGVDFVRLRQNSRELTIKRTDKDTIEDRVEENLLVPSFRAGLRWAVATFGDPIGSLEKNFVVYYLPTFIVALYQVTGDNRIFLEVEADAIGIVQEVERELREHLMLDQQYRSLFQIMIGDRL